tara:strand:+ start:189 stop:680 length:492 start_codon:yes stop_codon:yes gene_type:complete
VLGIPFISPAVKDVGVGAQRLHQALNGAVSEKLGHRAFLRDVLPEVEELLLLFFRVIEVGIIQEGGQIVLLPPEAKALEVDKPGFFAVEDDVLGLEVSMDEVAVGGPEIPAQGDEFIVIAQRRAIEAEVFLDEIVDEVVLLPLICLRAEGGREFKVLRGAWRG